MQKYIIKQKIGVGSFGQVYLIENPNNGDRLAMKKMKEHFNSQQDVRDLMEVKILTKLKHPNIVELRQVIYDRQSQEGTLLFEYCQRDICKKFCYSKKDRPTEIQIKKHIFEIASALCFAHQKNYIHRDLKPENILIQKNQFEGKVVEVAKLCDFGISKRADELPLTDYVGTRWYRAPQLLIKMKNYSKKVDVFSLGCIMAEFYNMEILFNGKNSLQQLVMIMKKLGTPTKQTWPEFSNWCKLKAITYGKYQKSQHPIIFRAKSDNLAQNLVQQMLVMNPKYRISSEEILKHPYFDQIRQEMLARQFHLKPVRQVKTQLNLQKLEQMQQLEQSTRKCSVKNDYKTLENAELQTDHSTHKKQDQNLQTKHSGPESNKLNQSTQIQSTKLIQQNQMIKQSPTKPADIKMPSITQKVKVNYTNFYSPYDSTDGKKKKFNYFQKYVLNRKNQNKTFSTQQQQSQQNQSQNSKHTQFCDSVDQINEAGQNKNDMENKQQKDKNEPINTFDSV